MQDPQITEQLKAFAAASDGDRDWNAAALLLAQVSGNRQRYRTMLRTGADRYAAYITSELNRYLKFRLLKLTHDQVSDMSAQADSIVAESSKTEAQVRAGKRPDHDSLPDDVKAAYAQTLDCLRRMRALHLKISTLALDEAPCPDSEIYPFVKEIIRIDKERTDLWHLYDTYTHGHEQAH